MSSIVELNLAASIIGSYSSLFCFILGVFGLSFNCIVFTRRIFENNPCVTYFLASTYVNIFVLLSNNLLIVLQSFGNIQVVLISVVICKFQRYMSWMSRSLSVWLTVLAIMDQYLNSFPNVNICSWSSMETAKRSIFIITITMMLIYIHMLILYTIESSGCNPPSGFYAIFSSILYVIVYSCLPIILMFISGLLTLINIREHKRILQPINTNGGRAQQSIRLNNQLLKMLIVQIIVISITTFPLSPKT